MYSYFFKSTFIRFVTSWILTIAVLIVLSIIFSIHNTHLANQIDHLQAEEEKNTLVIQQHQQLLIRKKQLIVVINEENKAKKRQEKQNYFLKNVLFLQNKYVMINHMLYEDGKIILSLQGKKFFLINSFSNYIKNLNFMNNVNISAVDVQYDAKSNQTISFVLSGDIS